MVVHVDVREGVLVCHLKFSIPPAVGIGLFTLLITTGSDPEQ